MARAEDSQRRGDGAAPEKERAPLTSQHEGRPVDDEPVTARDESAEPSGAEDATAEAERDAARDAAGDEGAPSEPAGAVEAEGAPTEPAAAEAEGAPTEPAAAESELADLARERDEYLALAQRTQADFENYRKRAAKEAAAAGERAKSGLVRELLPVVDNLERALASARDEEQHLAEGVRLVHSELIAVLDRNGVQQFDPRGETFDPTVHEALSTRSEDGADAGVVLDVVEKGYRMADSVLRPARVVVSG